MDLLGWVDCQDMKKKKLVGKVNFKTKLTRGKRCCCGHDRGRHGKFVDGGRNGKGSRSRYVCQAPRCSIWLYCDLA